MGDLRERALDIWSQLEPWQRFAGIGVILAAIGLFAVLGLWMQEPNYALLYRGLSERDAAAIVSELDAQGIPYRLAEDGTAVEVIADQVASARLKLAAKNLPQGGTGFEIFDQGGLGGTIGMTDFLQKMNYQRALEGELARSIMTIEGVEAARVHLALPEESLFAEQQQPSTASVVLKTTPGVRLTNNQVQAVRYLIANSVEGLEPTNISIVDVEGNLYDAPVVDEEAKLAVATASQVQAESQLEAQTQRDLQAMLAQALGPGKAVVRVNVEMDWDAEEVESTEVAPEGQVGSVVVSSQQEEESWTGNPGPNAEGVPGVDSNAPVDTPTYQQGDSTGGEYKRRTSTTNYNVSSKTTRRVKRPGSVARITVAVMLDESLSAEQADQVEAIVKAAVGFDQARGDIVDVQRIPFNNEVLVKDAALLEEAQRRQFYIQIGMIVAAVLALGLVLFFIRKIFGDMQKRMMPYVVEDPSPLALPPTSQNELPAGASLQNSAAAAYADARGLETRSIDDLFSLPTPDDAEMKLRAMARHSPDLVASILQEWAENDAPV